MVITPSAPLRAVRETDESLMAARLAATSGPARAGLTCWNSSHRLPLQPRPLRRAEHRLVRKLGYRGHQRNDTAVRAADVAGQRPLAVDDEVWRSTGVGLVSAIDMRDVADTVTTTAATLPTTAVTSYFGVHATATGLGTLEPAPHDLAVDAIVNRWRDDDRLWDLPPQAS